MLHDLLRMTTQRQPPQRRRPSGVEQSCIRWTRPRDGGRQALRRLLLSSPTPADEGWSTEVPRAELQRDYAATIGNRHPHGSRHRTELGIKPGSSCHGLPRESNAGLPARPRPSVSTACRARRVRHHFALVYMKTDVPWPEHGQPAGCVAEPVVVRLDRKKTR